MSLFRWLAGFVFAVVATAAVAGPPYLTDDPVPTETGHWEIYAFGAGGGRGSTFDGVVGVDLNYGAIKNMQLTATLPLTFTHEQGSNWRGGSGDVELGIKYRVLEDEAHGFSAAVFPRVILPTAAHSPGERTRFLLPVWVEKDFAGGTSIFGGGGLTINPGSGNRDFWQAGVAVTQDVSDKVSVGAELAWQGADAIGGTAESDAGVGTVVQLSDHYALMVSGGPTWADHETGYHVYAALGLNF